MKKILALILTIFTALALSGCFGGTDAENVGLVLPTENYSYFETSEFSIQYPLGWTTLTKSQISEQFKDNIEVAFTSNFKDPFFTPTITVEKVALDTALSVTAFADAMIKQNQGMLINFTEIERQSVSTLVTGQTVLATLIRFSGKEKLQDDTLEYLQIYLNNGTTGFIATAAYDPNDENNQADKVVDALRTLKLK